MWSAYASCIVNQTFRNQTKANLTNGLSLIEFGNPTKLNVHWTLGESDFQTNTTQLNKLNATESNPLDCVVKLSLANQLDQSQSNALHSIVFGNKFARTKIMIWGLSADSNSSLKKTCYWFSATVLRKSRVRKWNIRLSLID